MNLIDNVGGSQDISVANGSQQASRRPSQEPLIFQSKSSQEAIKQTDNKKEEKRDEIKDVKKESAPKQYEEKKQQEKPVEEKQKPVGPSQSQQSVEKKPAAVAAPKTVEPPVKQSTQAHPQAHQAHSAQPIAAPTTTAVSATPVNALDASKTATCRCTIQ